MHNGSLRICQKPFPWTNDDLWEAALFPASLLLCFRRIYSDHVFLLSLTHSKQAFCIPCAGERSSFKKERKKGKRKSELNPLLSWAARGQVISHTLEVPGSAPGQPEQPSPRPDSEACQQISHVPQNTQLQAQRKLGRRAPLTLSSSESPSTCSPWGL